MFHSRKARAAFLVGAASLLVSFVVFGIWRARQTAALPPVDVKIVQTLGPVFNAQLDALLSDFRANHPKIRVSVAVASAASEPTLVVGEGGAPLFAGDYVALVYNRTWVKRAPSAWSDVRSDSSALMAAGRVTYGIAIPDEPYAILPLVSRALHGNDTRATTVDAFSLLTDLRFAYNLTPFQCLTECVVRLFTEEKVAYALVGEWRLPELQRALGDTLGIAPVPDLPNGLKARGFRRTYGVSYGPRVAGRELEAAKEVEKFLTGEARATFLRDLGKLPLPLDPSRPESMLAMHTDAVTAEEYACAVALVTPIWRDLSAGKMTPAGASEALFNGFSSRNCSTVQKGRRR